MRTTLDQTLLALADPTRRAILRRLLEGEARVTELAQPFEMALNSVSKHIRTLERARLVRRRRVGREHLLSFNAEPLGAAARWIETQRGLWQARLEALDALLREETQVAGAKNATRPAPETRDETPSAPAGPRQRKHPRGRRRKHHRPGAAP
ncbi:MAG: winged helix-turn-helix transcriptional regulator [Candidatus Lambdaproteobacteria bacterium]|nr:winged helix-turn-helix transcriptional regulator [Candidatus Lambdaproteobacteria bacterium]